MKTGSSQAKTRARRRLRDEARIKLVTATCSAVNLAERRKNLSKYE